MNIALTHIHTAASARFFGGHGLVRALVFACAVAGASGSVLAGPERDRDGPPNPSQQREQPRLERGAPAPQQQPTRAEQRQFDSRIAEQRAEEQRRQAQQQDQGAGRRGGRLTPDERRELRRQINEAGTDLYPNTPRR